MPDPFPPRHNGNTIRLTFEGERVLFCGPFHHAGAVRLNAGIRGSEQHGPFVEVEIHSPSEDAFLAPDWMKPSGRELSVSPEGIYGRPTSTGFLLFLPYDVPITFERTSADGTGREEALSILWENDQLLMGYAPSCKSA